MAAQKYVRPQCRVMDRRTVELYLWCDHCWLLRPRLGDWQWIFNASVGFRWFLQTSHAEMLYCQHSLMVETTIKPRAYAFIVSDFQHALGNPALFLGAHVNIRQTSCRDSARLCSPCGEVGTRSVSTVSPAPLISCYWVLRSRREGTSVCRFKSVPTWWLCWPIIACVTR